MKSISPLSSFILALTFLPLGAGVMSAQGQSAPPASAPASGANSALSTLTPAEREQKRKVEAQVLANNADLKAEDDDLQKQRQDLEDQGASATPEAKKALSDKWHAHRQKVRAEALKLDPTMSVIYDKLDAWRKAHPKPTAG